jgi:hypothetical protein
MFLLLVFAGFFYSAGIPQKFPSAPSEAGRISGAPRRKPGYPGLRYRSGRGALRRG